LEGNQSTTLSRQIKQKEYELEKKLQRYNEALANNKNLRNQINSLRKERTLYDKIYNNLELDIMNKKNELLKLIEVSDKLEEKKIEYTEHLEYIKEQADREQEHFKTGYQNIIGMINPSSKLIDESKDMDYKSHKTSNVNIDVKFRDEVQEDKVSIESPLTKKKNKTSNKSASKSQSQVNLPSVKGETNADKYEELVSFFDKIFQETQLNDIDEVIATYKESEGQNEKLYAEVTD